MDSANDNNNAPQKTKICVICGKPQDQHYKPFCSKHCADVDLHRWLGGRYAIPVTDDSDEDGQSSTHDERE